MHFNEQTKYLNELIYEDFLRTIALISGGEDAMEAHRRHEERCAGLRRILHGETGKHVAEKVSRPALRVVSGACCS